MDVYDNITKLLPVLDMVGIVATQENPRLPNSDDPNKQKCR